MFRDARRIIVKMKLKQTGRELRKFIYAQRSRSAHGPSFSAQNEPQPASPNLGVCATFRCNLALADIYVAGSTCLPCTSKTPISKVSSLLYNKVPSPPRKLPLASKNPQKFLLSYFVEQAPPSSTRTFIIYPSSLSLPLSILCILILNHPHSKRKSRHYPWDHFASCYI